MRGHGLAARGRTWGAWVAGAVLLLGARPAAADILPPDSHRVDVVVTMDFGTFAAHVSWVHVVATGDTLEALARTHLGSADRKGDVTRLDGTRPAEPLKAGERLVMPPRPTAEKAPRGIAWWDAVCHDLISPPGRPTRFFPGEPYPCAGKSTRVYLVPHDRWSAFAKDATANPASLLDDERVLRTKEFNLHASAPDSDPTRTLHTRYRLEPREGNLLELAIVEQRRLDANGKLVAHAMGGEARPPAPMPWPLIAAAAVGLVGLALLARRRRAPVRAAPRA